MINFLIFLICFLEFHFFNVRALAKNSSSIFIDLNDTNLEHHIDSAHQKWFIMFYEAWCPHCKKVFPTIQEVAQMLKGDAFFGMVDW